MRAYIILITGNLADNSFLQDREGHQQITLRLISDCEDRRYTEMTGIRIQWWT
jgi:hypothetical protein